MLAFLVRLLLLQNVTVGLTLRYSPPVLGATRQSEPDLAASFPTSHCFSLQSNKIDYRRWTFYLLVL